MSHLTTREALEAALADVNQTQADLRAGKYINPGVIDAKVAHLEKCTAAYKAAQARGEYQDSDFQRSLRAGAFGDLASTTGGAPVGTAFAGKSIGELAPMRFAATDLKDLHSGAMNRHLVQKAAITSTTAPMAAIADARTDVWTFPRDVVRIANFIPSETTNAPTVNYFRATAAASAAAAVAEGANKPESTPTWESVTATVRKLAHYTRVNDEVIADFDGFLRVVGAEMIAGLIDEENDQLLNGTGVAPNILGLTATPGIGTVGSAGTDLDAIATAVNTIRTTAFLEPDIIIMHPNDWASSGFLLAKDTAGNYLLGNPAEQTTPRLWGIPVALTVRMTENTALVANLRDAARLYVRQAPTLEVQPGGGTAEFIANQTLIRAEERLALTVVRPASICLVTAV